MVTSLLFVNDWRFIALGNLVKEVVKIFGKIAQAILEWGELNTVTYDISKIEAVLFSKLQRQ